MPAMRIKNLETFKKICQDDFKFNTIKTVDGIKPLTTKGMTADPKYPFYFSYKLNNKGTIDKNKIQFGVDYKDNSAISEQIPEGSKMYNLYLGIDEKTGKYVENQNMNDAKNFAKEFENILGYAKAMTLLDIHFPPGNKTATQQELEKYAGKDFQDIKITQYTTEKYDEDIIKSAENVFEEPGTYYGNLCINYDNDDEKKEITDFFKNAYPNNWNDMIKHKTLDGKDTVVMLMSRKFDKKQRENLIQKLDTYKEEKEEKKEIDRLSKIEI